MFIVSSKTINYQLNRFYQIYLYYKLEVVLQSMYVFNLKKKNTW